MAWVCAFTKPGMRTLPVGVDDPAGAGSIDAARVPDRADSAVLDSYRPAGDHTAVRVQRQDRRVDDGKVHGVPPRLARAESYSSGISPRGPFRAPKKDGAVTARSTAQRTAMSGPEIIGGGGAWPGSIPITR